MSKFFIHIPKTGGTTVRKSNFIKILAASANNHINEEYTKNLNQTMKKYKEHHGHEHARYIDIRKDLRISHEFFAIVRNPWARVVSRYMFISFVPKSNIEYTKHYTGMSFEEFLEERHYWSTIPYFWHRAIRGWFNQKDYVVDENKNLKCKILRTEHLNKDLQEYFKLSKPIDGRKINVSNVKNKDYREFYNSTTINIVGDWYKEDIEFFGFDFDSSATKNI